MEYLYKMPMYKPVVCAAQMDSLEWTFADKNTSYPNILSNYCCLCLVSTLLTQTLKIQVMYFTYLALHMGSPHSMLLLCFIFQGLTLQLRLFWKILLLLLLLPSVRIYYSTFVIFQHLYSNIIFNQITLDFFGSLKTQSHIPQHDMA